MLRTALTAPTVMTASPAAMLGTHLLIAAGEAVITVAAVSAVLSTRPDLLRRPVYA